MRTAKGEQRRLQLPDGTQLLLNTATALDIDYSPTLRRLHLYAGEVLITTAPDTQSPKRPFVVDTPAGRAQALGTRFTVRHEADGSDAHATRIEVFEGAVELRGSSGTALRIDAGQAARLSVSFRATFFLNRRLNRTNRFLFKSGIRFLEEILILITARRPGKGVVENSRCTVSAVSLSLPHAAPF